MDILSKECHPERARTGEPEVSAVTREWTARAQQLAGYEAAEGKKTCNVSVETAILH
jgi:hypothetical protein